jgi:thymidylate synthase ThyX
MSKSSVQMVKHSVAADTKIEIATLVIRMPRLILAQFNTHRMFSRSAQSSRAIPVKKLLADVYANPYVPEFRENEKGMQSSIPIRGFRRALAKFLWLSAKNFAVSIAWLLSKLNVAKEIANRVLEPFSYVTVVVTSTEWDNFFELRAHPDAQADIDQVAVMIRNAINDSKPQVLAIDEWHLPFISDFEVIEAVSLKDLLKMSTARCARVSYLTHDRERPTREEDFALYARLIESTPMHASPCEHQATPLGDFEPFGITHIEYSNNQPWSGNFRGWIQHRQLIQQSQ